MQLPRRFNKFSRMTKVHKKTKKTIPSLDKLAQLYPSPGENTPENTLKTLCKRAKAKYFTNSFVIPLALLKSDLQKSYNNTIFGCSNILQQNGNKITGKYCGNRWCVVCNRIKIAKLINAYKPAIEKIEEKRFVTLTIKNVMGENLRSAIQEMTKTFQNIRRDFHKKKIVFIGIRKIECTYNPKTNEFHPHFHLIVSGKLVAEQLVYKWLQRYPNANQKAQNNKEADNNSVMELFKYFSKIITDKTVYIEALDLIFTSMYGLRVYQSFGIPKVDNVTEEIEELQAQTIADLVEAEKTWHWIENDWVDKTTGEYLTGYTPEGFVKTIVNNLESIQKIPTFA